MTRECLPNYRETETVELREGRIVYFVSIGRYRDGRPAEIFISCNQPTSDRANVARDAAVVLSIALQHAVPVEVMRDAITRLEDSVPASIIGRVLDVLGSEGGRPPPCQPVSPRTPLDEGGASVERIDGHA